MHAGKFCWTKNLFTHTDMVLSSNVPMESCGEYFLEYLRIQLIILRSILFFIEKISDDL
jgi:hypothetical protein